MNRSGRPLTASFVRTVKRPGRYGDGRGGHGLSLLVKATKNGRVGKYWSQRIIIDGRPTSIGLGSYPTISLAAARQSALENRREFDAGQNPRRGGIPTFEQATEKVITLHRDGWKPGSSTEAAWRNSFATHLYPTLGSTRLDRITTADVMAGLAPIWHEKPTQADLLKRRIGQVMRWAIAQGHRTDNPAGEALDAALPKNSKRTTHHKALHHSEVSAALAKIRTSRAAVSTRLAVEFLTYTATRTGEVRGATWSEIDLVERVWTIPAERMKAGREHRVPLSEAAIPVLDQARRHFGSDGLIFPGRGGRPLGHASIGTLFQRLNIGGTPHGMRSSFRDWCSESGVPREVAERALAHVVKGATESAYARSDLLDRRRGLMQQWADYITSPKA